MDCRNQTDSILMTLTGSAMDEAQKKICSTNGPIECLNETSRFYELAIIQTDTGLKIVEDQIPETSRKKIVTDLIKLKDLLNGRLNSTKCLIIEKDKELVSLRSKLQSFEEEEEEEESKENRIVQASPKIKKDGPGARNTCITNDPIKTVQNIMIKQTNSDITMLKERLDLTFEQIDQSTEVRPFDQLSRLLIEKETILITMKAYISDQSSKKDAMVARLMEERQQSALQTMAMEEHYMVLLNECDKEFQAYDIETKVREDVFVYVFMEIMNDMKTRFDFELQKIQSEIHIVLKPVLTDFQENVNEKLRSNLSRLDEIKHRVGSLSRLAVSIRNNELVYKKAFARRCENLLLAETEVDLLGDQVEALQDLLQKIYLVLDQNSSHYFQVTDILKIIKKG